MNRKEVARKLRAEGKSLKEIVKVVGAARSTVSLWIRDVVLTKKQLIELNKNNPASKAYVGQRTRSDIVDRAKNKRKQFQDTGRKEASNLDLHLAGCMLYWAEGAKNKNSIRLTNYDPMMVKFFVRFLRECYEVTNDEIKIWITVYSAKDRVQTENFWLELLDLPRERLGKTRVCGSIAKVKKNRHAFGGCSVNVNSTELVQRIFGSIKEYAGIQVEDLWLD